MIAEFSCGRSPPSMVTRSMKLWLIAFALAACSTTRAVQRPVSAEDAASINAEVEGKTAAIQLRNAICCSNGEDVLVTPDAIEWTDESPARKRIRAPAEAVEQIIVRYHGDGAARGALVGGLVGAAIAVLAWIPAAKGEESNEVLFFITVPFAAAGALVFALIGGVVGLPHHIELTSPPP
ncbi:MAG TPA: hypothetical protein VFE90_23060 [Myxococcales bacterium]|nr:hypothetical protein [Myxococcales bacterium]